MTEDSEYVRNTMKIIPYEEGYRDDLIFMVLEAKMHLVENQGSTKTFCIFKNAISTAATSFG